MDGEKEKKKKKSELMKRYSRYKVVVLESEVVCFCFNLNTIMIISQHQAFHSIPTMPAKKFLTKALMRLCINVIRSILGSFTNEKEIKLVQN